MPSIAAHLVVAKLILEQVSIDKNEFYKGCILPDIIKDSDSHLKVKGNYYLVPNIEKYKNNNNLNNDKNKGYLCHLLLDKYFLDEYVINNVKDYNKVLLFTPDLMYNDYTNMNYLLVKKYDLNLKYINDIMDEIKQDSNLNLDLNKLKRNIDSINSRVIDELHFIEFDKFCLFIEDIIKRIKTEIMR